MRQSAAIAAVFSMLASAGIASAGDRQDLDGLVRSYPDFLSGYNTNDLIWRDGTRMALSAKPPATSFPDMLRHGSILDQMRLHYPPGTAPVLPAPGDDPGRIRDRAFFDKMYGDCRKGEVAPHLVPVVWLPRTWGHVVEVTAINGVARHLAAVAAELDALPDALKRFVYPPAGTYNCRAVADTGEPSMHAWGAAIDINVRFADYWLWHRGAVQGVAYVNRIPADIVAIFERNGFIWGGKWYHYDTMHFEYRPELLPDTPQ